jgi:hypothetical protein
MFALVFILFTVNQMHNPMFLPVVVFEKMEDCRKAEDYMKRKYEFDRTVKVYLSDCVDLVGKI